MLGDARRHELSGHAARSDARLGVGPAGGGHQFVGDLVDHLQPRGCRIAARVGGVEPIDVRQQHQQVRADHLRGAGGQAVVVAIADLLGGHRVVLVDHRDGVQAQQGLQGGAGVQPAAAHLGVVTRQQHLGAGQAVRLQGFLPGAHQQRLACRRRRLFFTEAQRALAQAQALAAERDGAGGDDHHLLAPRAGPRRVLGEGGEPRGVGLAGLGVDQDR